MINKRKISPNERMYITFEKNYNSFMINRVVMGSGSIEVEMLQKAVDEIANIFPESRYKLNGKYWIDSKINPQVMIIQKKDIGQDFKELMKRKIDPTKEPACQIYYLKEFNKITLIFRTHHGVMDGKGQGIWIEAIFKKLNLFEIKREPSKIRDIDLLKRNGIEKNSDIVTVGNYSPIKDRISYEITSPISKKLIIDGKISSLTSKLMGSIHTLSEDKVSRFIVTRDIREKFKSEDLNVGNLSLPMYLEVQDKNWKKINIDLINMILKNKDIIYSPKEYFIFGKIPINILQLGLGYTISNYNKQKKTATTAVISNLGRIDLENYKTKTFYPEEVFALPVITPLVPLSFVITELENKIILTVGYYEENYDNRVIETYLEKLKNILSNKKIVNILGEKKVKKLDIFEEIFKKDEEVKIGVIEKNKELTYKYIFEKTQILYNYLKRLGVEKGDRVSISTKRDSSYLISILACIKAGAVFIPIDPEYPKDRINYIKENSKSKILLEDITEILLEKDIENKNNKSYIKYNSEDVVYTIYTSGSTGNPKGVEITYGTLCNYISNCIKKYDIDKNTIFGFFTSISFDLSITAIFTTLVTGGQIEFFDEKVTPVTLKDIFENSKMNSVKMTPTHLEIMSKYKIQKDRFKLVIVGGEQLKVTTAKKAQDLLGDNCKIVNEYGPTEATVGCVYHIFDKDKKYLGEGVPIGKPLDNIDLYLDIDIKENLGELLIGGDCLAKGYSNNPIETEKKFIYLNGKRFYKSGDLCRINVDEDLEFLERKDFQVKIRGYRIELEEIEKKIEEFSTVSACRVIPNSSKSALLAYYIGVADENELRKFLKKNLPEYMIPYAFFQIDEFPLNSNGKLDLKKLRELNKNIILEEKDEIELSTFEKKIIKIWESILEIKIQRENIYKSFYELGADSLSIVRFINEIEPLIKTEGVENIILNPTLETIKLYSK
ncbi:AMP-binding protein [Cetobacterium somerae]|uniref:non-ribosomal peptide synthetase n=1 Tax=Cetobacterium sp. NK01 TaxID=2993530 RepID=UPI0021165701|nr:AMP-binding protein [Cetobacterium sp. NK01]MCQ8212019.1 AMP-binding protein [Cetobacterium sp. NK01]